MTTYYHSPLSSADAASLLALNTRFSDLDAAIYNIGSVSGNSTLSALAGEGLSDRAPAYINPSDGKIYLLDSDTSPARAGVIRGFVDGAVLINTQATLVIRGIMDGFSGLTTMAEVYVGTTAGSITQTRPVPALDGNQIAIMPMGYALDTDLVLVAPRPIQYQKRIVASDNETVTVAHHADNRGFLRNVWAYITESDAGTELAGYASSNQDSNVVLRGPSTTTSILDVNVSGQNAAIGNLSGTSYRNAQSFIVSATGTLTQFKFTLNANVGTPTGGISWQIRSDNAGNPGTTLKSGGPVAVSASAENTVNVTDGPSLTSGTTYWLVLFTQTQTSGNYYQWRKGSTASYADGQQKTSSDGGTTWSTGTDLEIEISVQTTNPSTDKLAQSFTIASTATVDRVTLWLREVGAPAGTLTLRIETNNVGSPSGTLVNANATVTVAESSLTTSYAAVVFNFATDFELTGSTTYWLVLSTSRAQSNTDYVQWGADGSTPSYSNGEMKYEASGTWSAESKDAVFSVIAPGVTHPSRVSVDWWSSTYADVVNRYGDGAGADLATKTTFKCLRDAGFEDLTVVVELP
jgi:hypothetical protein